MPARIPYGRRLHTVCVLHCAPSRISMPGSFLSPHSLKNRLALRWDVWPVPVTGTTEQQESTQRRKVFLDP